MIRLLRCLPLLFVLYSCGDEAGVQLPPNLKELRDKEPLSESYDVDYRYTDSAKLKTRLRAPHDIERRDTSATYDPQAGGPPPTVHYMDRGVRLEFYNIQTGQIESSITANRGELYQQRGMAIAIGNVVVTNTKGEKLETERLNWSRERDEIYTDQAVRITTAREVLFGKGLVSNTSFTRYRILKLTGTIALPE